MSKKDQHTRPMYVLEWLSGAVPDDDTAAAYEYRLQCGGEAFNAAFREVDWSKEDGARYLLREPFRLIVANWQYMERASCLRELALSFTCSNVVLEKPGSHFSFNPHAEIAEDIAALLTAYCRRLVSVAGLVRIQPQCDDLPEHVREIPVPITTDHFESPWPSKPASVLYSLKGIDGIVDYNPSPAEIDSRLLQAFFKRLPDSKHAERVVLAARLYATALELIHRRPDLSYLLLIFAVDTLAGGFGSKPDVDYAKMEKTKKPLKTAAKRLQLDDADVRLLIEASCVDNPWNKDRFTQFVIEHTTEEIWATKDELFRIESCVHPDRDQLEQTIRSIFESRSQYVHAGESYPVSIFYGLGPRMPAEAMHDLLPPRGPIPPVPWFERVVNVVFRQCVKKLLAK